MDSGCSDCGRFRDEGARFCGVCGKALNTSHSPGADWLEKIAWFMAATVTFVLLLEIANLLLNFSFVFGYEFDHAGSLSVLAPFPVSVYAVEGVTLQIYWTLLVIAVISCFSYACFKSALWKRIKHSSEPAKRSRLFWIAVISAACYFFEVAYGIIITSLGYSMDSSWIEEYTHAETLFTMLHASVWEELVTRVMFIGIPITILGLAMKKNRSVKCLFGGFGISRVAIVLIVAGAILFGFAHAPSWGLLKVLPTFFFGLMAGYLYVKYGLYASILMHFFTDYLPTFSWAPLQAALGFVILLMLLLGLPMLIYLWREKLSRWDLKSVPLLEFDAAPDEDLQ
jgi:hypothetical protein